MSFICLLHISEQTATFHVHKLTDFYNRNGECLQACINTAYKQKLHFVLKKIEAKLSEVRLAKYSLLQRYGRCRKSVSSQKVSNRRIWC